MYKGIFTVVEKFKHPVGNGLFSDAESIGCLSVVPAFDGFELEYITALPTTISQNLTLYFNVYRVLSVTAFFWCDRVVKDAKGFVKAADFVIPQLESNFLDVHIGAS